MKTGCHSKGFLSVDCIHSQQRSLWESLKPTWLRWKKVTVTYVRLLYEDRLPLQRVLVQWMLYEDRLPLQRALCCHSNDFFLVDCPFFCWDLFGTFKATWNQWQCLTVTFQHLETTWIRWSSRQIPPPATRVQFCFWIMCVLQSCIKSTRSDIIKMQSKLMAWQAWRSLALVHSQSHITQAIIKPKNSSQSLHV